MNEEHLACGIQQVWQGPSGRSWNGDDKSCCVALPGQADWFRSLAKACNAIYEAESLAAFERYKETKWLEVPASTLNELLHIIQTKEYQRGYKDGVASTESYHDGND